MIAQLNSKLKTPAQSCLIILTDFVLRQSFIWPGVGLEYANG